MPDGKTVANPAELKGWMVKNIDAVGRSFSEHFLIAATGRDLSHIEKQEVADIVRKNTHPQHGMRTLVLDLLCSDTFRR